MKMKKKMKKADRCWSCKKGPLRDVLREETVRVGGRTFKAQVPWRECMSCGESTVRGPDLEAFELAVALELARSGSVLPDAFKYMRKAIGLTAVELGALLELRAETISRIENGRLPADRRTVAILGALVEDEVSGGRTTRDRLEALGKPKRLSRVVQVVLA